MKNISIFLFVILYGEVFGQAAFNNTGNVRLHTNANIAFYGNFSNSGTLTDSGQASRFTGTVNQSIAGTSATTFHNLYINNTAGVTLNQNTGVSSALNLTQGSLSLNSQLLTISVGSTSAITRTGGYIVSEQTDNSGRLRWNIGTGTGAHVFPLGKVSGEYIPFTVNLTAGNIGNVTVATYPTAANNTPYPTAPNAVATMVDSSGLDNSLNTVDRFWQIDKDGPSGTATLTFTASATEIGSIIYVRKVRRWNAVTQAWEAPLPGQTFTATTVTVPGVSSFSPWAMAGAVIPLPIELVSFTAKVNGKREVDLAWITASEINNDYFTVERSTDLVHYETVVLTDGAGNSNQLLHYADVDQQPYSGISYYRLKQTDFDGSYAYSPPVSVNLDHPEAFTVSVFPNPTDADNLYLSVSGMTGSVLTLKIMDMMGKVSYLSTQTVGPIDAVLLRVPNWVNVAAGIYTLSVADGSHTVAVRVLIR